MKSTDKIEVVEGTVVAAPCRGTQMLAEQLAEIAAMASPNRGHAVDSLLLSALEIAVHEDKPIEQIRQSLQARLTQLLAFAERKHADCIAELGGTSHTTH